jgi:hypothetical protein
MTIWFSEMRRTAARPDTNAARRAEPSPNVLMDPVSFTTTLGCSSDGADVDGAAGAVVVAAANDVDDFAAAAVVGGDRNSFVGDAVNIDVDVALEAAVVDGAAVDVVGDADAINVGVGATIVLEV